MRYAYHDAAFSSNYDSTIFNFQTARLGQYNPTTNRSLFFGQAFFIFQNMQFIRGIQLNLMKQPELMAALIMEYF